MLALFTGFLLGFISALGFVAYMTNRYIIEPARKNGIILFGSETVQDFRDPPDAVSAPPLPLSASDAPHNDDAADSTASASATSQESTPGAEATSADKPALPPRVPAPLEMAPELPLPSIEKAAWLNIVAQRIFMDMRNQPAVHRQIIESLENEFNDKGKPAMIGRVHIKQLNLGPEVPRVTGIQILASTHRDRVEAEFDMDYKVESGFSFTVTTTVLAPKEPPATAMESVKRGLFSLATSLFASPAVDIDTAANIAANKEKEQVLKRAAKLEEKERAKLEKMERAALDELKTAPHASSLPALQRHAHTMAAAAAAAASQELASSPAIAAGTATGDSTGMSSHSAPVLPHTVVEPDECIPITVRITVHAMRGRMHIMIPPGADPVIRFGFVSPPELDLRIKSGIVGWLSVNLDRVPFLSGWIDEKIDHMVKKHFIWPQGACFHIPIPHERRIRFMTIKRYEKLLAQSYPPLPSRDSKPLLSSMVATTAPDQPDVIDRSRTEAEPRDYDSAVALQVLTDAAPTTISDTLPASFDAKGPTLPTRPASVSGVPSSHAAAPLPSVPSRPYSVEPIHPSSVHPAAVPTEHHGPALPTRSSSSAPTSLSPSSPPMSGSAVGVSLPVSTSPFDHSKLAPAAVEGVDPSIYTSGMLSRSPPKTASSETHAVSASEQVAPAPNTAAALASNAHAAVMAAAPNTAAALADNAHAAVMAAAPNTAAALADNAHVAVMAAAPNTAAALADNAHAVVLAAALESTSSLPPLESLPPQIFDLPLESAPQFVSLPSFEPLPVTTLVSAVPLKQSPPASTSSSVLPPFVPDTPHAIIGTLSSQSSASELVWHDTGLTAAQLADSEHGAVPNKPLPTVPARRHSPPQQPGVAADLAPPVVPGDVPAPWHEVPPLREPELPVVPPRPSNYTSVSASAVPTLPPRPISRPSEELD